MATDDYRLQARLVRRQAAIGRMDGSLNDLKSLLNVSRFTFTAEQHQHLFQKLNEFEGLLHIYGAYDE